MQKTENKKDELNKIKSQIHNRIINADFDLYLNLSEQEKEDFISILETKFNTYFDRTCELGNLFETYELPTANDAVLFLLTTSHNIELTWYKSLFDVCFLYLKKENQFFNFQCALFSIKKKQQLDIISDLNIYKKNIDLCTKLIKNIKNEAKDQQ